MTLCPFHSDHSPSLCVNLYKGLFICYGCGRSGHVQQLALELGGRVLKTTKTEAKKRDDDGWKSLFSAPLAIDHPYLASRKVTNEQVDEYEILNLSMGVGFPLHDRLERPVGLLIRRSEIRPGWSRYVCYGEKPEVWPMKRALGDGSLLFVEGIFGVLRTEAYGVKSVAVLGSQISEDISWALNKPRSGVLFDDDAAGYLGAGRALRMAPTLGVCVPGAEADELDDRSLANLMYGLSGHTWTNSLSTIANEYAKKCPHLTQADGVKEFYQKLPKSGWTWNHRSNPK